MKTHNITVTVTAPNRITGEEVAKIVERLIWIGKEDAALTLNNGRLGEGDLKGARDAMSLCLKFGDAAPVINVRTLKQKIEWVVKAEVANSWKGGRDPADIPYIEANLKSARAALNNYLKERQR